MRETRALPALAYVVWVTEPGTSGLGGLCPALELSSWQHKLLLDVNFIFLNIFILILLVKINLGRY